MKYIKTYELFDNYLDYKKDDYVYVTGYPNFDNLAKISLANNTSKKNWDYLMCAREINTGKYEYSYIDESDIDRKLTPDEINEYEARKDIDKYNL